MKAQCEHHVKYCKKCQLCKHNKIKYGKLPQKDVEKSEPWNRVNVDLIGPLPVHAKKQQIHAQHTNHDQPSHRMV